MFLGRISKFNQKKQVVKKKNEIREIHFKSMKIDKNFNIVDGFNNSVVFGGNGSICKYVIDHERVKLFKKVYNSHSKIFSSLSHRKDEKVIIAGTNTNEVFLFDSENMSSPLKIIKSSKTSAIRTVHFLSNTDIFYGCVGGATIITDVLSEKIIKNYDLGCSVESGCVKDEDSFFVGLNNGVISFFDKRMNGETLSFKEDKIISTIKYSGNEIFIGCGGSLKIWDLRNINERIFQKSLHKREITGMEITNKSISTASFDGTCKIWNRRSKSISKNWKFNSPLFGMTTLENSLVLLSEKNMFYSIEKTKITKGENLRDIITKKYQQKIDSNKIQTLKNSNQESKIWNNLSENELLKVLIFIEKNIDNPESSRFIIQIFLNIIKEYSSIFGFSKKIDDHLRIIRNKVNFLLKNKKELLSLRSLVEATLLSNVVN